MNNPAGTGHRWLKEHLHYVGDDCLLWPFTCCTPGYGQLMIDRKVMMAHRVMCQMTKGPAPTDKHHAAHSCGNRRCVNPRHLSWKTPAENQSDRAKHGTQKKRTSTLSPMQVVQIQQLRGKETSIETAAKYGVTESNVRLIQDGKTWKPGSKWWTKPILGEAEIQQIRSADSSLSTNQLVNKFQRNRKTIEKIRGRQS